MNSKTIRLALLLLIFLTCSAAAESQSDPRHPSKRPQSVGQQKDPAFLGKIEREKEWITVDKTSSQALQAYLDRKPQGSRVKEAAALLPVAKKLEAIIAGKEQAKEVIPFAVYGERMLNWEKKLAVAASYNATLRVENETGACFTYRQIDFEDRSTFTKGVYAQLTYASWPRSSHAAPGSILAFDSGGDRAPVNKFPVIVSAKSNVVYFGVVENVGFVHLAGQGEVIYPDGRVQTLR